MKLFAPMINDITTDTDDPPSFSSGGDPVGRGVVSRIRKHYADLEPLRLDMSGERAFRVVLEAAERMSRWKLTVIDRDALALEGFALTGLFRFRDDFVIRVRDDDGGAIIDMRSRSRTGKGDFGANAERIRAFFKQLRGLLSD